MCHNFRKPICDEYKPDDFLFDQATNPVGHWLCGHLSFASRSFISGLRQVGLKCEAPRTQPLLYPTLCPLYPNDLAKPQPGWLPSPNWF